MSPTNISHYCTPKPKTRPYPDGTHQIGSQFYILSLDLVGFRITSILIDYAHKLPRLPFRPFWLTSQTSVSHLC